MGYCSFSQIIGLVRTVAGLTIAHTVMTFPYSLRMVISALARMPWEAERAAAVLGPHPVKVFTKVRLPGIRAGIDTAALFTFLLLLNSITAVFIAGPASRVVPN